MTEIKKNICKRLL